MGNKLVMRVGANTKKLTTVYPEKGSWSVIVNYVRKVFTKNVNYYIKGLMSYFFTTRRLIMR